MRKFWMAYALGASMLAVACMPETSTSETIPAADIPSYNVACKGYKANGREYQHCTFPDGTRCVSVWGNGVSCDFPPRGEAALRLPAVADAYVTADGEVAWRQ
jgi:hypothetical protein